MFRDMKVSTRKLQGLLLQCHLLEGIWSLLWSRKENSPQLSAEFHRTSQETVKKRCVNKSDDGDDDADCDDMATMSQWGLAGEGGVQCKVSRGWRLQPCQYLANSRGTSASRS